MLKSILDKLGLSGQKTISRQVQVKKTEASNVKNGSLENPSKSKRPVAKRADRDLLTISRKEHVPQYQEILSYSDGEIALSNELENNYVVLLLNKERRQVCIICALEASAQGETDNSYLTIKDRCVNKGYAVKKQFASRQLIEIIYEDDKKKGTGNTEISNKDGITADFDRLIAEALSNSVSDMHIEVRRVGTQVRFRRHGELSLAKEWTAKYGRDMAVVIYQVLADEKEVSFIETQQQAAKVERVIDGRRISIRLNTIPESNGFDMVMRLLNMDVDSSSEFAISDLGYRKSQISDIFFALSKPVGVIIIAGTTGSGKSVSLSTMLNGKIRENSGADGSTIKVITVEDPTEYIIKGATQSGVVRKKGNRKDEENPFAEAIKAAMRCDPDILMVGEVRDEHSAKLLMGAVQSGHTALTTVHAGSAIGIIARLRSMDIPDDVLGSNDFISALIFQTLLQVTCKRCGESWDKFQAKVNQSSNEKDLELIDRLVKVSNGRDLGKVLFRNHAGCKYCVNGVSGRTVVAEVIMPTPAIRAAFSVRRDNLALYHHMNNGGTLILEHGIEKILEGISDPHDVEKALGLLTSSIDIDELAESLGITRSGSFNGFNKLPENKTVEIDKDLQLQSEIFNPSKQESLGKVVDVDFSRSASLIKSDDDKD
jgi:type II secretory ATPase GspE/PulE/Tfp pilus assembly ATPase PilB-like protein